jgi:hypothetical protein
MQSTLGGTLGAGLSRVTGTVPGALLGGAGAWAEVATRLPLACLIFVGAAALVAGYSERQVAHGAGHGGLGAPPTVIGEFTPVRTVRNRTES